MKRIIVTSLLSLTVFCISAQERRQTINKEYGLTGPSKVLRISNVSGFIKVEGYDGQKVTMNLSTQAIRTLKKKGILVKAG